MGERKLKKKQKLMRIEIGKKSKKSMKLKIAS